MLSLLCSQVLQHVTELGEAQTARAPPSDAIQHTLRSLQLLILCWPEAPAWHPNAPDWGRKDWIPAAFPLHFNPSQTPELNIFPLFGVELCPFQRQGKLTLF